MHRLNSPAAERNKDPIATVLREVLPAQGLVFEVASGSGQHVVHFAKEFPHLQFQPSDPSDEARTSIQEWIEASGCENIHAPLAIDCTKSTWPALSPDAIICINMIHISPWAATVGLLEWAASSLAAKHPLVLYGPFWREGFPRELSNVDFDRSLSARNPDWGIRRLADVERQAAKSGLRMDKVVPMPANNLCVIFHASGKHVS